MKYGVILARFQPVHKGHIALIRKACFENDKVVLLVGSADKFNERNPIPIDLKIETTTTRKKYVEALREADKSNYRKIEKIIHDAFAETLK